MYYKLYEERDKVTIGKLEWNPDKMSTNPREGMKRKTQAKNSGNKQKTNNKTGSLNSNILIIALKVNDVNIPIKRQRLAK